ncbi:MAG: hypothetical protein HYV47_02305 [Candidatus Nealsonbacteria bacterium]|nr:hypothetical protein [Candidatus Nealsonbacteria bacterium]
MVKRIDPHVHCRDGKEHYKANIRRVSELAKKQGVTHICDMPNTNPPILREKDVIARIELAGERKPVVGYSFYVKLTADEGQIKEAARLARDYPQVCGLKLYPPENENRKIYQVLADEGYSGVLAIHAEKFSLLKPELFVPKRPWTHNLAHPPEAEIESIKEQIRFSTEANFRGNLYICHITLPESAKLIWQAKKHLNIYSEITPHHLLMNNEESVMDGGNGLLLKVNPPLRSREASADLLKATINGLVDCLGTDYAPHTFVEKLYPPYLSGIASYGLYGMVLNFLREQGMPEKDIEKLTYWNIKKIFGDKLKDA